MSTKLEKWINTVTSGRNLHEAKELTELGKAILVIEILKTEMEFAMKYYESCGGEAEPEFQLFKSFEMTLKLDPENL